MRFGVLFLILIFWSCQNSYPVPFKTVPSHKLKKWSGKRVDTEAEAISIAEPVWKETYGTGYMEDEKPYTAKLENGIWYVNGTVGGAIKKDTNAYYFGGAAYMEIKQSNGDILLITHYK